MIDKSAPMTTDDAPTDWVNTDVTVHLTAEDNGSGVDSTFYTLDGGDSKPGTSVLYRQKAAISSPIGVLIRRVILKRLITLPP